MPGTMLGSSVSAIKAQTLPSGSSRSSEVAGAGVGGCPPWRLRNGRGAGSHAVHLETRG